jgi:hypothetical protein
MEVLISWGSPLGLGLLFFLSGAGVGIFFWGISHIVRRDNQDQEG